MIALQARNPQIADPSAQTAKYVNMMNMAKQQEAAQRQSALAQQQMDYNRTQEARAVETQASSQKEASLTYLKNLTQQFKDRLATISPTDKVRYGLLRQQIVAAIPPFENELPLPDEWNKDSKFLTISKADDVIKYSASTPVASLEVSTDGIPMSTVVGGLPGVAEQRPVYDAPDLPTAAPAAVPAVPTAGAGVAMRATGGANTTPQDLIRQGMNPDNVPSGMPTSRPISFNQSDMGGAGAAQMTPELMSNIVDSAFQTGVMAQVDFDQLLASQPPQNKQALMDSFQRANITLQADAPSLVDSAMGQQPFAANPVQTPEASFARLPSSNVGARNASPFETTLAQTQPRTITRIQQKTPNVSPAPAEIPLERRGAEARVERITPGETRANTLAQEQAKEAAAAAAAPAAAKRERDLAFSKERGTADAKFMESAPAVVEASNEGRKILNQMIGDAYVTKQGKIAVPKGGRSPHAGFESVVGLGFPGMRFVPGSQSADFDRKFKQVLGKSFLKAFNDLRGGGSITEIEGVKATEAITRLSRFSSEVEFIRAARELEDILAKGEQRALDRRARIEGKSAPSVSTPTSKKSNPRELRFNPATGGFN
jgi:hypothetical protein